MSMLENIPAVRQVQTDRSDLASFDIVGRMSPADFENLFGLLEAAYALHPGGVDVMIRFIDFDGVDPEGVDPKTDSDGRERAAAQVRRCAVVAAPSDLSGSSKLFVAAGAAEARSFKAGEEDEAWAWLGATPPA